MLAVYLCGERVVKRLDSVVECLADLRGSDPWDLMYEVNLQAGRPIWHAPVAIAALRNLVGAAEREPSPDRRQGRGRDDAGPSSALSRIRPLVYSTLLTSTVLKSSRSGRRPGKSGTREAILRAAARQFSEHGFENTSLRGVAREAGVDPALVVHYFGGKSGLFVAAFEWRFDPKSRIRWILRRGHEHVGEELARLFVEIWDRERRRHPLVTLLRSATVDPAAAALLRDVLRNKVFEPLLVELDVDRPELRANLVASQLLGLALARHVVELEPLAGEEPEAVVAAVGPTLQRYLTGELQ